MNRITSKLAIGLIIANLLMIFVPMLTYFGVVPYGTYVETYPILAGILPLTFLFVLFVVSVIELFDKGKREGYNKNQLKLIVALQTLLILVLLIYIVIT